VCVAFPIEVIFDLAATHQVVGSPEPKLDMLLHGRPAVPGETQCAPFHLTLVVLPSRSPESQQPRLYHREGVWLSIPQTFIVRADKVVK
jgi:hypothetical protein